MNAAALEEAASHCVTHIQYPSNIHIQSNSSSFAALESLLQIPPSNYNTHNNASHKTWSPLEYSNHTIAAATSNHLNLNLNLEEDFFTLKKNHEGKFYVALYEFMRVLLDSTAWNFSCSEDDELLFRGIGVVYQFSREYSNVVDLSRVCAVRVYENASRGSGDDANVRDNANDGDNANVYDGANDGDEDELGFEFTSSSSPSCSSLLGLLMNFLTQLPNLHIKFMAYQTRQRHTILESNATDRTQANRVAEECAVEANGTFQTMLRQIRYVLWHLYGRLNEKRRMGMRRRLGCYLSMFGAVGRFSNSKDVTGLSEVLSVVQDIVVVSVLPSHTKKVELVERDLVMNLLVPLFSNNCLSSWRDQRCTLASYYAALSKLIITIVSRKPICKDSSSNFANEIFESIVNSSSSSIWPKNIHTGKLILILCMVQELFPYLSQRISAESLCKICSLFRSEHSQVAEKSLMFFSDASFIRLIKNMDIIENESKKTTYDCSSNCFPNKKLPRSQNHQRRLPTTFTALERNSCTVMDKEGTTKVLKRKTNSVAEVILFELIQPGAVHWNPTVNKFTRLAIYEMEKIISKNKFTKIIEGIFSRKDSINKNSIKNVRSAWRDSKKKPSLGVTGVAPWAKMQTSSVATQTKNSLSSDSVSTFSKQYAEYLNLLVPIADEIKCDPDSVDLSKSKFHNFVFESAKHKLLGEGAFGTVKFAKYIVKSRDSHKNWPCYAIKCINKEKLVEFDYWSNVNREMAILMLIQEKNLKNDSNCGNKTCNIIKFHTSFFVNQDVYLVLEYAPFGDLLNYLPIYCTGQIRYIMNEVLSGLLAIHKLGFVYGDLKPENLLVCREKRIKIADFGASRPVTDAAKVRLEGLGNLFEKMRDGHWLSSSQGNNADFSEEKDGERVEGTVAYLPPEIVLSSPKDSPEKLTFLDFKTDSWALGCLLFQICTCRIPSNKVSVGKRSNDSNISEKIGFENYLYGHVLPSSHFLMQQDLILDLLRHLLVDYEERYLVEQANEHPFIQEGPCITLDVADQQKNASKSSSLNKNQWARRQYSSIWAPLNPTFDISSDDDFNEVFDEERYGKINVGKEALAPFSSVGQGIPIPSS